MSGPFRSTDNGELPLERRGKKTVLGKGSVSGEKYLRKRVHGDMAFQRQHDVWLKCLTCAIATQQKRTSSILLFKEKSLVWEGDLKSNTPFPSGVPFRCFLVVDLQLLRKDSWVDRQP